MLAQFRSSYPQGNLLTELVQIYHGKYIVRASVQIEGVIRATGMACESKLEEAEDQARNRALMVLGISTTSSESVPLSTEPVTQFHPSPMPKPTSELEVGLNQRVYSSTINSLTLEPPTSFATESNFNSPEVNPDPVISEPAPQLSAPEDKSLSPFNYVEKSSKITDTSDRTLNSNVTPFTPRSYNPPENGVTKETTKKKKKSEPIDLSDVIAKTDVEIERLGWTKEQGRDHLKKTYGKIGRTLLTEEELLDFLRYLEAQPTPPDPLAGF
ncbi:hypothetical protein [Iningainema tapete]|uniref:Uncharacterized protein n=1 Tax=Iningainema tapete BLCC-T55 TaxID=2748662 RepID=A0A8J7CEG0_9CYAN|nr:hypothetical protein [Iningainema tapete]MBD2773475.1 hypothetical protein [Iningainema tapete BLCC-T55]